VTEQQGTTASLLCLMALNHDTSTVLAATTQETLIGNYFTLAFVTVLLYDYWLTVDREVRYVWKQPWTAVS
jgi:hypothetical protein